MNLNLEPGDYVFANVNLLGAYDGDTIWIDVDVGFHFWRMCRIGGTHPLSYRLLDIDAPELRPLVTRQVATEARDYLLDLMIYGQPLVIATYQLTDADNFGRYLVHLWQADGTSINRAMIDSGHAVPYER